MFGKELWLYLKLQRLTPSSLLPFSFADRNYLSFHRQLNQYGWTKPQAGDYQGMMFNPAFYRGMPAEAFDVSKSIVFACVTNGNTPLTCFLYDLSVDSTQGFQGLHSACKAAPYGRADPS